MTLQELRPGELLMLILPNKDYKGTLDLTVSYEDVLEALKVKKANGKSRRSTSAGRKLSRMIGLTARAVTTGKWSTGAPIQRDKVASKLLAQIAALSNEDLKDVTENAVTAMQGTNSFKYLSDDLFDAWNGAIGRLIKART